MIITNLRGGLGNQMFQYAIGLALSQKNNNELLLDNSGYFDERVINSDTPRHYKLDEFNIKAQIATKEQILKIKYPFGPISKAIRLFKAKILKKHYQDFHPEILELKGDIYLDGFFQSEKYFKNIRPQLLQEFTLKSPIKNQSLLNEIRNSESVSVHIRRGDYVTDQKTNKYHGTPSIEYYKQSIDKILSKYPNSVFYFFSDDIEWVKENFPIDNIKMKIGTDINHTDCEELILMSKCKHNIIANSSFSWWSAWLNKNSDKIVIAPKRWTNIDPCPHKNIIPETWIKI